MVLLSFLYDSGARVRELADLKVKDIRTAFPSTVKLTSKGNKSRIVPLMKPMSELLRQYLIEFDFEKTLKISPYGGFPNNFVPIEGGFLMPPA